MTAKLEPTTVAPINSFASNPAFGNSFRSIVVMLIFPYPISRTTVPPMILVHPSNCLIRLLRHLADALSKMSQCRYEKNRPDNK